MSEETLDDGTRIMVDWSEGGRVVIECACDDADPDEPVYLLGRGDRTYDEAACPACGRRFSAQAQPSIAVCRDGDYVAEF